MLNLFNKLVGDSNEKALKAIHPLVDAINELEPHFEKFSDGDLKAVTVALRSRYTEGESLDDLLPEAFAAVREASKRTIGMRHFDVQLIGGIVLHEGKIAEMRTGEGNTCLLYTSPSPRD